MVDNDNDDNESADIKCEDTKVEGSDEGEEVIIKKKKKTLKRKT